MGAKDKRKCSEARRRFHIFFSILIFLPRQFSSAGDADVMGELEGSLTNLPSSWKPGTNPCGTTPWEGVTCDSGGHVTDIDLAGRGVSGTLPSYIVQLSSLKNLILHQNQISGELPSLQGLASLQFISIFSNSFTFIPSNFFTDLSSLQRVVMDNNPLAPWSLPDDLKQCISLSVFSASNSSITGSIPPFLGSMPSLQNLRLSYNNLSGSIPAEFAGSGISSLWLNNQQSGPRLTGSITVVGSMAQLSLVWLQSNGFTGPIPDVSNLTLLQSFNVRDNSLTGTVPASLLACSTLNNVTLSNNYLQGPFPVFAAKGATTDINKGNSFCKLSPGPCDPTVTTLLAVAGGFGYPMVLATSWTGNDACSNGWLGILCDAAEKSITVLNLANQHLTGTISSAIVNLTLLTKLMLNNNGLTGQIPGSLASLPQLQLLDVSNNNLSGTVPIFASSVNLKISGNSLLNSNTTTSSPPGTPGEGVTPGSPPSGNQSSRGRSSSAGMIVGIIVSVIVIIACIVGLFYYKNRRPTRKNFGRVQTQSPPRDLESSKADSDRYLNGGAGTGIELHSHSSVDSLVNFGIETQSMTVSIQVLRRATNNFSEENVLGRGGFGVVYKGILNGMIVAIKRNESDLMGQKGLVEFHAEISVLTKVRHRHLVALLSYCIDGNERLLVYEYMPEGTLGDHLFDCKSSGHSPLSWKQRLSVALDVARGVEYLHSLARESFIHRDLKPSNILLGRDMRAKVADFGLVKLADNKDRSMMTKLAGTFGYLAPEYAITGRVSTKIDVYAFGVILMELITGRRAVDGSQPEEETHLVTYFRRSIINRDKFINSVDPSLVLDDEDQVSLFQVAELAHHCTHREPQFRPDMGHVVNVLVPLVQQWKPSSSTDGGDDTHINVGTDLAETLARWQSGDSSSMTDFSATTNTMTSKTWKP